MLQSSSRLYYVCCLYGPFLYIYISEKIDECFMYQAFHVVRDNLLNNVLIGESPVDCAQTTLRYKMWQRIESARES